MPLIGGYSQESISENIKRLISEGNTRDKAVAISHETARRAKNGDGVLSQLGRMQENKSQRKLDRLGITEKMVNDNINKLEKP